MIFSQVPAAHCTEIIIGNVLYLNHSDRLKQFASLLLKYFHTIVFLLFPFTTFQDVQSEFMNSF